MAYRLVKQVETSVVREGVCLPTTAAWRELLDVCTQDGIQTVYTLYSALFLFV